MLAFQLAGADGLRAIHAGGRDEERETPPAEPLLVKLIERPQARGLSTLILVDEVLMYAREKAGVDPVWRDRIVDFFQSLTQAMVKVDRAAIAASLLATDPNKQRGEVGRGLVSDLFDVFRRQREEGVQPVQKEDVAEVLRRRFFEPEEVRDPSAFRSHVIGVVRGLAKLDETTAGAKSAAEERFLSSFPFHPDLTDVFYSRWTQLESFQRTRGILRTLATALREAEQWDSGPLIGPSALLAAPGREGVSDAVRELAGVATSEKAEGSKTAWAPLLEAELDKARQIQRELPALRAGREAEQAVIAVFLHSQIIGHRASTPELVRMAGSAAPDPIELEKGLRRWREISWFLDDEDAVFDVEGAGGAGLGWTGAATALPRSWRLGNRPNLRQMHDEACRQRVSGEAVEARLEGAIRETKLLAEGAAAAGTSVHLLPASPRDVGDDGRFRYAVLGAEAASMPGKPSPFAKRFLDETTSPSRPRVHRNAVVLAVPSRDGVEAASTGVRSLLGWEDVERRLSEHRVDPVQSERLRRLLREARTRVPEIVRQAYSLVVTVNEENDVHAFRLKAGTGPLFAELKNDERSRVRETAVDAEALLPDGPYDLWRDDDESRFVKDLAGAFARYPRLPKVLNPKILLDTILQGVERGLFVARLARPDGSSRTWWREAVEPEEARADPSLEVILPEKAELGRLPQGLLAPGALPELWAGTGADRADHERKVGLREVMDYFRGGHVARIPREGYDDVLTVPRCPEAIVREAIERAVERGTIWLTNGPTSVWKELLPYGALGETAVLHPAPEPVGVQELTEEAQPGAWQGGRANGVELVQALSQTRGTALPWGLVREGIRAGVESRWLRLADDSGPVHCGYGEAGSLLVERPAPGGEPAPAPPPAALPDSAVLEGSQIQDLADLMPDLLAASAGNELRFHVRVTLGGEATSEVRTALDEMLAKVSESLNTSSK